MGSKARSSRGRGRTPLSAEPLVERAASALVAHLPGQRWFGAKARTIAAVTPVDWAPVSGTRGLLALFRVSFTDGESERYLVPLLDDDVSLEDGSLAEALDDLRFCAALVEQVQRGGSLAGQRGVFRFSPTPVLGDLLPEPPHEVVRMAAEQSNTSLLVDGKAILKLFRKLEPGPNPEFELTDFLTRETEFRGAPRLAGSIVHELQGEEPATVGVLHEFVPTEGDAWTATQARLAEYYAAVNGRDAGSQPNPALGRALAAADAREARELGALTGRLHVALASAPPDSPLGVEPITPADLTAWHAQMERHLDRVMAELAAALDALPAAPRDVARRALEEAPRFREGLAAVQGLATEPVAKIRIHGDYHLGQVLRTAGGFVIVDFEGEPARPLAERRAKQCALKDVAGMLRSFAYAARAALLRAAEAGEADAAGSGRLAPWADAWEDGVRTAFLEGYLAETRERGAQLLPRERQTLDAVLRVFELDKAIYELRYELNHRPAWLEIPLHGLRRAVTVTPKAEAPELRPGEGPFGFVACLELREFVGVRAENERQLAELIEQVPLDSIYYHTHGFLLRHKFVAGLYPNDFATWVAAHVGDRALGERLAMVDPAEFPDLQTLREELVAVIDDHLRSLSIVPGTILGDPFEFLQSRIVEIPTGVQARTLPEFRHALLEVDVSAIYHHLVEARLRLGRGQNDFAAWLERGLGLPRLAARIRAVSPYADTLERTRARLIQLCDEALAEGAGS